MVEECISLIPGFNRSAKPSPALLALEPRKRFAKAGVNADHSHTVRMRHLKNELRLTTTQLVRELNAYELEHHAKNLHSQTAAGAPAWLPMTPVLMSSYLQGWVVQESFMALVAKRLEHFYQFKQQTPSALEIKGSIRTLMDGWYTILGIDPKDPSVSPSRQLARLIAPYSKRPALEPVKDTASAHEPSMNHTTFYRWYASNKMPRSIKTLELVQAAVNKAAKTRTAKR